MYAGLREAQGRMEEAKEMRLQGAETRMVCARDQVSWFSLLRFYLSGSGTADEGDDIAISAYLVNVVSVVSFLYRLEHGAAKLFTRGDLKACGACESAFYCSRDCQKEDWTARHKPLCKAYTLKKSQEGGSSAWSNWSAYDLMTRGWWDSFSVSLSGIVTNCWRSYDFVSAYGVVMNFSRDRKLAVHPRYASNISDRF